MYSFIIISKKSLEIARNFLFDNLKNCDYFSSFKKKKIISILHFALWLFCTVTMKNHHLKNTMIIINVDRM